MKSATHAVRETAPAKLNLYLHIVDRRPDGLHVIDSLVVFAELGDVVTARPDAKLSLTRSGPMAGALPPADADLVLRAARRLADAAGATAGAAIALEKNLPVASGLGGGSADAAATVRALCRLWQVDLPAERLSALALELGADVPVCLAGRPARVAGIGEQLSPVGVLARLHTVLVNPGIAVATAEVFAAHAARRRQPDHSAGEIAAWSPDPRVFAQQLVAQRNDLTAAATSVCPAIADVLARLAAQPDCLLARMSGSGATCFGLFASGAGARAAAAALARERPRWWVAATALDTGPDNAGA